MSGTPHCHRDRSVKCSKAGKYLDTYGMDQGGERWGSQIQVYLWTYKVSYLWQWVGHLIATALGNVVRLANTRQGMEVWGIGRFLYMVKVITILRQWVGHFTVIVAELVPEGNTASYPNAELSCILLPFFSQVPEWWLHDLHQCRHFGSHNLLYMCTWSPMQCSHTLYPLTTWDPMSQYFYMYIISIGQLDSLCSIYP